MFSSVTPQGAHGLSGPNLDVAGALSSFADRRTSSIEDPINSTRSSFVLEADLEAPGLDRPKFAGGGLQESGRGTFEFRALADAVGRAEVLGHAEDAAVQLLLVPLRGCSEDLAAVVCGCRGRRKRS